jgi:hypothetical protein
MGRDYPLTATRITKKETWFRSGQSDAKAFKNANQTKYRLGATWMEVNPKGLWESNCTEKCNSGTAKFAGVLHVKTIWR